MASMTKSGYVTADNMSTLSSNNNQIVILLMNYQK